jgi:hypothetical protein
MMIEVAGGFLALYQRRKRPANEKEGRGQGAQWGKATWTERTADETGQETQKEQAMIEQTKDEVAYYYYDSHPTEEDLMGESPPHAALVHYLMEVLTWLFHDQPCAIYENFNFYQTNNRDEKPLAHAFPACLILV